ncbi:MAG: glycosyltransferase family 4 protein [Flavobacteriales bacterium]|nr:glycosyltransferase family 4 protein [Flavobacteriales bacterium]
MGHDRKRILFLVPYPLGIAPSQRFRFEQYFDALRQQHLEFEIRPFLDEEAMRILYKRGNLALKVWKVLFGLFKRFADLFTLWRFDMVFIHREAAPIGPPVFEWLIAKVLKKKVIFDFDDAIWIPNSSSSNPFISFFKRYENAESTCAWAWKVSCGNSYLRDHAARFNTSCYVNPTTIDTVGHHNRVKIFSERLMVIGWTGTHSTIRYIDRVLPILKELEREFNFEFLVIADKRPDFELKSLRFVPWDKASEIDDLLCMDVGIMPLENDRWAKGKCGFKALQYMALGIPAIVSPVGVNTEIVSHGVNGWVCDSDDDWMETLRAILSDPSRLPLLSDAARSTVEMRYSVKSNTENFLRLFQVD